MTPYQQYAQKPKEFHLQDDEGDTIYTDTELNSEEKHRKNRSKCNHEKIVANKNTRSLEHSVAKHFCAH